MMWSLNNNVILSSGDDPTRTVDDVMVENLYVEANKFALVCTELCIWPFKHMQLYYPKLEKLDKLQYHCIILWVY